MSQNIRIAKIKIKTKWNNCKAYLDIAGAPFVEVSSDNDLKLSANWDSSTHSNG